MSVFSRPMPCSAEKLPPYSRTIALTQSMMSWLRARKACGSISSGCARFMWMLPSPRWPNGTGRLPGMSRTSASDDRLIISGTAETGTETSFFTLAPARFWPSGCSSRSFQMAARWATDSASAASSTSPASIAASSTFSSSARSPASGRDDARSTST